MIGQNPVSLRFRPLMRPEIEAHVAKAHDLTDLMRWESPPSIITKETREGPCFQWRNAQCLLVYLNGSRVPDEMVPVLPLDMLETLVVLGAGESVVCPRGAILLYTAGWIR